MTAMQFNLKLPSAYTVVAYHRIDDDDGYVLCHLPTNKATPFASWRVGLTDGVCVWGDYYHTDAVVEALEHFERRARGS